jgi:hypothetical protein
LNFDFFPHFGDFMLQQPALMLAALPIVVISIVPGLP